MSQLPIQNKSLCANSPALSIILFCVVSLWTACRKFNLYKIRFVGCSTMGMSSLNFNELLHRQII